MLQIEFSARLGHCSSPRCKCVCALAAAISLFVFCAIYFPQNWFMFWTHGIWYIEQCRRPQNILLSNHQTPRSICDIYTMREHRPDFIRRSNKSQVRRVFVYGCMIAWWCKSRNPFNGHDDGVCCLLCASAGIKWFADLVYLIGEIGTCEHWIISAGAWVCYYSYMIIYSDYDIIWFYEYALHSTNAWNSYAIHALRINWTVFTWHNDTLYVVRYNYFCSSTLSFVN